MAEQQQVISRVSNYPLVKDTWSKVSEVYQRGKDGSRIIRFCGGVAETSASLAYMASQPVLDKLPVGAVNDYALNKLESLEEKYPVIVKPTEEMVDAVKSYSTTKLEEAKNYSTDKFNQLADIARLNAVIGVADIVVDSLLPPVPTQEESNAADTPAKAEDVVALPAEASTRVRMLSDKVKRRAYDNAMAKAGALQKRSQAAVEKLIHTIDLIDFAQENIRSLRVDDVKDKVKAVYEEVTEEGDEMEPLPADASVERKAIATARALTLRARQSFRTISNLAFALPAATRTLVTDAYNYTDSMYHTFSKTESFKDFSSDVIRQLRERLTFLEETAANITNYVLQAAPLQWLANGMRAVSDAPDTDVSTSDSKSNRDSMSASPVVTRDEVKHSAAASSSAEGDESDRTTDISEDDSILNSTANSTANCTTNWDDNDDVE